MSNLPILSAPVKDEPLFLYLVVFEVIVSAILFKEEQGKQEPIFNVSRMLLDTETRYSIMEKLVLALVNAKKEAEVIF